MSISSCYDQERLCCLVGNISIDVKVRETVNMEMHYQYNFTLHRTRERNVLSKRHDWKLNYSGMSLITFNYTESFIYFSTTLLDFSKFNLVTCDNCCWSHHLNLLSNTRKNVFKNQSLSIHVTDNQQAIENSVKLSDGQSLITLCWHFLWLELSIFIWNT